MTMYKPRWITIAALLAVAGCDHEPTPKGLPSFEDDAGSSGDADVEAKPERKGPQFAVVSSDWSASSVSLLGLDGALLADDYLTSGSTQSGLVTALSGDVELPTRSGEQGVLVLIDRYKTDVITRVNISDGTILGQVKTHTPPTQATSNAYTSNPHDYLRIDDSTAWVTRNQPNLDPSIPDIDKGNDLLRIDPTKMERTDERIDLSSLNTRATRKNPDTGADEEVNVFARPSRMTRVGGTLIVGLGRSAFDFSAFGSGMVAVVDLDTKSVEGLVIEGLQGCTSVKPIPDSDTDVLVGCGGVYKKERESAGVAIVHVEDGKASISSSWRAQDHADQPALSSGFVALSSTRITASSNKYSGSEPSVFGTLDLTTGVFTQLLSTPAASGTFGTPFFDADTGLLLVPDASVDGDKRPTSGVRLLQQVDGSFEETSVTAVSSATAMPARHVFAL